MNRLFTVIAVAVTYADAVHQSNYKQEPIGITNSNPVATPTKVDRSGLDNLLKSTNSNSNANVESTTRTPLAPLTQPIPTLYKSTETTPLNSDEK